jgi:DNA-binding HxlR family transcriptional regulator
LSSAKWGCAINAAIEVLGAPWSMLVLRDVIFGNRRHFRKLLEGLGKRMLSNWSWESGSRSQLRP